MKKNAKAKKSRKNKTAEPELPGLVEAMAKLVERLEGMERKMDQVLGRVSNLPAEIRRAVQDSQRPQVFHPPQSSSRPDQGPTQSQGPRERILHQAVCADCRKNCEVPFRPSGDRPVYCPECWAIRKVGHAPKDLTSGVIVPKHLRDLKAVPAGGAPAAAVSKGKKQAAKAEKKKAKKKK
jgi:CxxC-x17-CxxC domain-containing protein